MVLINLLTIYLYKLFAVQRFLTVSPIKINIPMVKEHIWIYFEYSTDDLLQKIVAFAVLSVDLIRF